MLRYGHYESAYVRSLSSWCVLQILKLPFQVESLIPAYRDDAVAPRNQEISMSLGRRGHFKGTFYLTFKKPGLKIRMITFAESDWKAPTAGG